MAMPQLWQCLNDHRDSLAAPDAGCRQSILRVATAKLVQQGNYQAGAGCAQRMSEGDGAAIYVDFVAVQTQFFFHCEILTGKGFVDLDQVDIFELQSAFFESLARRRDGSAAHDLRLDSGDAPANDPAQGL